MSSDNDAAGSSNSNSNSEETSPTPSPTPSHVDNTLLHTWVFEPATSDRNTKSLTDEGVEAIAAHKYKPGHYTWLDNFLNPGWTALTELLPMWLAPNMVTFLGFLHCGISYCATWYYSPNFDRTVPDWVIFLSGYAVIAYYTLDCMDGKQARRTGQSSPLGQLFDHGFDCISNLCHISTQAGFLSVGGTWWFFALQGSIFFAFFMAQWEEYYTGELPHAMGNFGVTEVNYFMGFFAIFNSFIDRESFWQNPLGDKLPEALSVHVPSAVADMEVRHFGLTLWLTTTGVLIIGSLHRVLLHKNVTDHNLRFSALSKLATPFLIAFAPFSFPYHIIETSTRHVSLCMGFLMIMLTIKMICFSMARQSFATIQLEALPYCGLIILIKTDYSNNGVINDTITAQLLLGAFCLWYFYRLLDWASKAIQQICKRLDIYCFSIKNPKTKNE